MNRYLMFQIHSDGGYGPIHDYYFRIYSNGELRLIVQSSISEARVSHQLPVEALYDLPEIDSPIYDYRISDGKHKNHIRPEYNWEWSQLDGEEMDEQNKFYEFIEELMDVVRKYVNVEKIRDKVYDLVLSN